VRRGDPPSAPPSKGAEAGPNDTLRNGSGWIGRFRSRAEPRGRAHDFDARGVPSSPVAQPEGPRRRIEQVNGSNVAVGFQRQDARPGRRRRPRPAGALDNLPDYVRGCRHNPDPRRPRYAVFTWPRGETNPRTVTRRPYSCGSWRCPFGDDGFGPCAVHESHVLFERMREAFGPIPESELLFMVLTLEPELHQKVAAGGIEGVYRAVGYNVQRFKQRLNRWLARRGLGQWGSEWIGTVEAHASGTPHVNVMFRNRTWAKLVREQVKARRQFGQTAKESILIDAEIVPLLRGCGLGAISTLETIRGGARGVSMAQSYMAALAKHADASAAELDAKRRAGPGGTSPAELAKRSQIPYRAPKNFRRIRSGKRFLPPRRKGDQTGTILRLVRSREGDEEVRPLIQSRNVDYNAVVEKIVALEDRLIRGEETDLSELAEANRKRRESGLRPLSLRNYRDQETTSHVLGPPLRGPPAVARAGESVPTQLVLEDLQRLFGDAAASG